MSMISHFYSDPHFWHQNIIKYAGRPFADVEEMNRELERRYRESVYDDDTVLWVGDVAFGDPEQARSLICSLPGRKILVRGNHDGSVAHCLNLGFDLVMDSLSLKLAGHRVAVYHRPKDAPYGIVIHGHTHTKFKQDGLRISAGVDAWDFRPAPLSKMIELVVESAKHLRPT